MMQKKLLMIVGLAALVVAGAFALSHSKQSGAQVDLPVPALSFKPYDFPDNTNSTEITLQLIDEGSKYAQQLETALEPLSADQYYQFVIREITDKRQTRPDLACMAATELFNKKLSAVQVDPTHAFNALAGWFSNSISERDQLGYFAMGLMCLGMSSRKPYVEKAVSLLESGSVAEKRAARSFLKVVMRPADSDAQPNLTESSLSGGDKGNLAEDKKKFAEAAALSLAGAAATVRPNNALPPTVVPEILIARLRAGATIDPRDVADLFSNTEAVRSFNDELRKTSGQDSTRLAEWLKTASSSKPN